MKMSENVLFKSSFWLGRLIWVSGAPAKKQIKLAQMLAECGVGLDEFGQLNAHQFIDMCSRGFSSDWRKKNQVLVVGDLERLKESDAAIFLRAMKRFLEFCEGHTFHLVLVSSGRVSEHLLGLSEFKPVHIFLEDESDELGGPNEKLHSLISLAMSISGVTIRKLTERAAIFLEEFLEDEGEEDTFLLILRGLLRANGWELRLSDLIANLDSEASHFTPRYDT